MGAAWAQWAHRLLAVLSVLLALVGGGAQAGQLPGELPALVGRLSAVQGDVRWLDRDSGQWVGSTPGEPLRNWPVAGGDRLRTGADARADLRIGSLTVRLGPDAELWLQRLDEQALVLQLEAGTLALRLPAVDGDAFGPVEVTSREGRWIPQRPGSYRLDRQPDATQATSWQGELRFEGRDSQLLIPAGRRADLWLDGPASTTPGRTRLAWAPVDRDEFADWVARDERLDDAPATAQHVPPGMTGWQDLDRHGDWVTDPELGSLWQPRVLAPGWAPFRTGRWAWVAPWGWTWIDAAPWGFAPFHYGAWLVIGGRWSWSPGPRHQRPRYAPALNVWIQQPGVGVGVQIGGGWRPPPPRVVMPVVVPIVVHRPGRPVVIVNTPVQRPWPPRPGHPAHPSPGLGAPHGPDRPPPPGARPMPERPRGDGPRADDLRGEAGRDRYRPGQAHDDAMPGAPQRPDGQRPSTPGRGDVPAGRPPAALAPPLGLPAGLPAVAPPQPRGPEPRVAAPPARVPATPPAAAPAAAPAVAQAPSDRREGRQAVDESKSRHGRQARDEVGAPSHKRSGGNPDRPPSP